MKHLSALLALLGIGLLLQSCPAPEDAPAPADSPSASQPPAAPEPRADTAAENAPEQESGGLNAELVEMKANSKMDDESRKIMDDANTAMAEKEWGLAVGAPAPTWSRKTPAGADIVLGRYLARKEPVVMLFYRGEWCPYCKKQLLAMNEVYPQIKEAGAELVAISPEKDEFITKLVDENGLAFPVVSDPMSEIAQKYMVAYEVDPGVAGLLGKFGIDVAARNGDEKAYLPQTSVFVIDGQGNVAWRSVTVDYTVRAEPADVVAAVETAVAEAKAAAG